MRGSVSPDTRNAKPPAAHARPAAGGAEPTERDPGPPEQDARPTERDAGPSEYDASPAEYDAGSTEHDTGPAEHDAGSTEHDAGLVEHDTGPTERHASPAEHHARPTPPSARPAAPTAGPSAPPPDPTPPNADPAPPGRPAPADVLRGVPLLRDLPAARIRALWQSSVPRRYAPGEVLRAAGEPAGRLLLLLDGRVAATVVSAAGRVVRVGAWSGPCALDKVAVIDDRGHTATFTALTPCAVRSLPRADFLALVDDASAVRAHVLRILAAQARDQQTRFTATATLPASARLAAWLLAEAARLRSRRVPLPGGQQPLADHLGVTRVTLNRALSALRREGVLTYARGEVEITAPEALALRATPGRADGISGAAAPPPHHPRRAPPPPDARARRSRRPVPP